MAALNRPPTSPMAKSNHTKPFQPDIPPEYYYEVHHLALKEAPGVSLTDFKTGKKYSIFIKTILKRVDNIIGSIEVNKLANKLKIALIARRILNSYDIDRLKFELGEEWDDYEEKFELAKDDAEHEIQQACKAIEDIYESPTLPAEFMNTDPRWKLPDITKDCGDEKISPISLMDLIQGQSVKLTDEKCYNFDDVIGLYKSKNGANMVSPMTRVPLVQKDIDIMRMLVETHGGKKTKVKTKKTKKTKNKKTRN
jgi:hypothetical protein